MSWHFVTTDSPGWAPTYGTYQTDNAKEIWNILVFNNGWTENSASAVLGNFQSESYINPGQWEIGYNYSMSHGMGLGQWTPATKVSDFVGSTNRTAMANGSRQMDLFLARPSQYSTYYLNPDGSSSYYGESGLPYISSMAQFSRSNASISDLTKLWAICWERPGARYYRSSISSRITHATHWYNEFSGSTPPGPEPPPTPPEPPGPPTDEEIGSFLMCMRKRTRVY